MCTVNVWRVTDGLKKAYEFFNMYKNQEHFSRDLLPLLAAADPYQAL